MNYTVRDVLARLIQELGGEVEGVKKLMKLVFLVQYEFPGALPVVGRLARRVFKYVYRGGPAARAEFFIWSFGPMSNEVYEALEGGEFSVEAGEPPYLVRYAGEPPALPQPVEGRVREVARRYGRLRGWELERRVAELLDLVPEEKKMFYMGWPVDKYLEHEGFRLVARELGGGQDSEEP